MGTVIKFGTDGWRGVIARDFTFHDVKLVTQAVCDYLRKPATSNQKPATVLVGYDCRFLSQEYARTCARVLSGNGFKVWLSGMPAPTPALSYSVVKHKLAGAVIITASHNPYNFNGFKFKTAQGVSAGPEVTRRIENLCGRHEPAENERLVSSWDPKKGYLRHLGRLVDLAAVKKSRTRIVIDPMYGAAQNYLEGLLADRRVKSINNTADPLFGGVNPEPIGANLGALRQEVRRSGAGIGIAFDGDGDRIGLVDRYGSFVNSHQIFCLLLLHLVRNRKQSGLVVKTISGTFLLQRICDRYGLELKETPIGFKYIGDLMLKKNVLIGGEESGGIGFRGHIPERDGILSALYILELMTMSGLDLAELRTELFKEFGVSCYDRVDLVLGHTHHHHVNKQDFSRQMVKISRTGRLAELIRETRDYDGVKLILRDGSWLLLRPSGTEPVVRIYAEAGTERQVKKLIDTGRGMVYKFKVN